MKALPSIDAWVEMYHSAMFRHVIAGSLPIGNGIFDCRMECRHSRDLRRMAIGAMLSEGAALGAGCEAVSEEP